VERDDAYASAALAAALGRSQLEAADRALATELVYGVLRLRTRLAHALNARAARGGLQVDPTTRIALEVAAYQILFLDRVPAHAAVDDAVGAVKRAHGARLAGFANALLRKLATQGEPAAPSDAARSPVARAAWETATPDWIAALFAPGSASGGPTVSGGPAAFARPEETLRALGQTPPLWLRVNTVRAQPATARERLAGELPRATLGVSALVPEAVSVRGAHAPPSAWPSFADGSVSVQDLGAQAVVRLAAPQPGWRVLDACAGRGGKTAHLFALMQGRGELVAADLSERKLEVARQEWARLGVTGVRTVAADLTDPAVDLGGPFDLVVLDAPCSGLGVLRRHPELKWRRRPEEVAALAALQARLLDALLSHVRPGGILCYSVCTFTEPETTGHLARLLARGTTIDRPPDPLLAPAVTTVGAAAGGDGAGDGLLRLDPARDDADAFTAFRLRVPPLLGKPQ
jgi:16S rRNA (cytosine967-C5)-methyltransferase